MLLITLSGDSGSVTVELLSQRRLVVPAAPSGEVPCTVVSPALV